MVPNAKALIALGVAFAAGASTVPLITAGRSPDPVRSSTGPGSPTEAASGARTWEDPITAKLPDRPISPPARPTDGAPQAERTLAGRRQARPSVASIQDSPSAVVPPPVHRRPRADASPVDGSASKRPPPVGDAPARRPVQRLAGNFQGQGAAPPARGGDGLLRWLFER